MERTGLRGRRRLRGGRLRLERLEARELLAVVTTAADNGDNVNPTPGSLRAAIIATNGSPDDDTITFNIATGPQTINLTGPLPQVTDSVNINGTTQPGFASTPIIELNGSGAGATADGLVVIAGSSTIQGLVINRFHGSGIVLRTGGSNIVTGNYIGVDTAGTAARANDVDGIFIDNSGSNTIGSTSSSAASARNIISGNTGNGIYIAGINATQNAIQNNFIGTGVTGTTDLRNGGVGVRINGASRNSVGGTAAAPLNTIAFNGGDGVHVLSGSGNLIRRNSIFNNTGLGINLDPGANNNIVAPQLTLATTTNTSGVSSTVASGTYAGSPNTTYTLDFYSNPTQDTPTTTEGRTFIGSATITTNGGGTANFNITTTTSVAVGQFVVATATDPSSGTSEFSASVQAIAPTANLSITGTRSPEPVAANGFLTYTYTITNAGPTAGTVTFTDTLPTGVSFVQATSSQGSITRSGSTLTGALGTLAANAGATVTIVVVPTVANNSLSNTATVTSPEDTDTSNNSVTLTSTVVAGINLFVQPTANPSPVNVGSTVAVTYVVSNTGAANSTATTFQANTPAGLELVSVTPSQGTATIAPGNGSFSVDLQSIAANAGASVVALYRAPNVGSFTATGTASGTQPEVNPADNTGSVTFSVQTPAPPSPIETTPPTVIDLSRFGVRRQPTSIVLAFSESMNGASATNPANYRLVTPGRDGRFNTADDVQIRLARATYNAARNAVALSPARRIPLSERLQITVNGSSDGVRDLAGNQLDGNYDGLPGSDFVARFTRFGLGPINGPQPVLGHRARRRSRG